MRDKTFFIDEVEEFSVCGNKMVFFKGAEYRLPFHITLPDGEHKLEDCADCLKGRDFLAEQMKERNKLFPLCCDEHSNLTKVRQFNFKDFEGEHIEIATKIYYAYNHIINVLDKENWFEDISNYIKYVIESLGCFPSKCGAPYEISNYFNYLEKILKKVEGSITSTVVSKKELNRRYKIVINYVHSFMEENPKKNEERDARLLLDYYDKWFKIFPFELSYFSHLKKKYKSQYPILESQPKYNPYLNMYIGKVNTKEKFVKGLLNTTHNILSKINALELYEKGELTNADKIALELIIQNRKLQLKETGSTYDGRHSAYIKALKKWFKDEQKFIKDIKPYLKEVPAQNIGDNSRPNRTDIAYCIYYLSGTKELKLNAPFPSGEAWKEIGERYFKNSKNVEYMYNIITAKKDERLKKSKIKNIEYVIDNMLNEYPKAKELAKDELKLAKLNL